MDPVAKLNEDEVPNAKRIRVDDGRDGFGPESHVPPVSSSAAQASSPLPDDLLKHEAHEVPMHPCGVSGVDDPPAAANIEPKIQPGAYTQREEASHFIRQIRNGLVMMMGRNCSTSCTCAMCTCFDVACFGRGLTGTGDVLLFHLGTSF